MLGVPPRHVDNQGSSFPIERNTTLEELIAPSVVRFFTETLEDIKSRVITQ